MNIRWFIHSRCNMYENVKAFEGTKMGLVEQKGNIIFCAMPEQVRKDKR